MFSDQNRSVGAGTGDELVYLARCFPLWRFTVVEPSGATPRICGRRDRGDPGRR
jgi:tRNA (cmo5U34)-methyltransferase